VITFVVQGQFRLPLQYWIHLHIDSLRVKHAVVRTYDAFGEKKTENSRYLFAGVVIYSTSTLTTIHNKTMSKTLVNRGNVIRTIAVVTLSF